MCALEYQIICQFYAVLHISLLDTYNFMVSKQQIYVWPLAVMCVILEAFYNLPKSLIAVVQYFGYALSNLYPLALVFSFVYMHFSLQTSSH